MLQTLSIQNFAIIDDLKIAFGPGLTIFSGETGAGKSIIINAINLLLGSRATARMVRTGAKAARLEAEFEVPEDSPVRERLRNQGFEDDRRFRVDRIISSANRHKIAINGRPATIQVLAEITELLASISGQHAHQLLLNRDEHLRILDRYSGGDPIRERLTETVSRIQTGLRERRALLARQRRQQEQMELIAFQRQEIEAAALVPGEDIELETERNRLKNAEFLYRTAHEAVDTLYGAEGSVFEVVAATRGALEKAGTLDGTLAVKAQRLAEAEYVIEDLVGELRSYLQGITSDDARLEAVEARLDRIHRLKKKYGGSLDAVMAHLERIRSDQDGLENLEKSLRQNDDALSKDHAEAVVLSRDLSEKRRAGAGRLGKAISEALGELEMVGTEFEIDLEPIAATEETAPFLRINDCQITEAGSEMAEFLISPNVGETLRPLAAIASGGELSRVVLGLKAMLARQDELETVVFDEVDAGIGGKVADVVGKKLAELAAHHQIVCITHLPQIARYADHHFRITKAVVGGRTQTRIEPLDAEGRVEEIARMLGGSRITATTREHARELLRNP